MGESILIVAGEASADLHGAHVLQALQHVRSDVRAYGVGGSALRQAGLQPWVRAEDMSVAGLTEVLFALPRLYGYMQRILRGVKALRPSVAVLIDMPDFNLPLAKRLKAMGIPVIYYISPQLWAWREGRVDAIRAVVDEMLVILPFEQAFYARHNVRAQFVGHPLVEQLLANGGPPTQAQARAQLALPPAPHPIVALLPGSRRKELQRHLPTMLASLKLLAAQKPGLRAVLPIASTLARTEIEAMLAGTAVEVLLVDQQSTAALMAADAAIVCSGTATLQAALLQRPMVVVYRVSWLSYFLLRRLIKVAHIALVNLIAGRAIVPELVQKQLTDANVAAALLPLMQPCVARTDMQQALGALRAKLSEKMAAPTVAGIIASYLKAPQADILPPDFAPSAKASPSGAAP